MLDKLSNIVKKAKKSSFKMASIPSELKNQALKQIAIDLTLNKEKILAENKKDLDNAKVLLQNNEITTSIYNRLKLDDVKFQAMIESIEDIIKLENPIGKKLCGTELDKDLKLYKISCPIGVLGVIFEARPDVISQITALAIKSSNVIIFKGGKEAKNTNSIITSIINASLDKIKDFPKNAINQIFTREEVNELLKMNDYVDLIIPRGGNNLVKYIKSNTQISVLGHADGICHIYVDEKVDYEKAINIILDSKTQYPSACNAVETILIHKNIADKFLPILITALKEKNVIIKGCEQCLQIDKRLERATEKDWETEYSDLTISVKIVDNVTDAIEHINTFGSGHTDCIITEDKNISDIFMELVDSAGVYANASTRFADGYRYGLGAEVGISTNKTHARGPVGLEGLTIYKYKLYGTGQIVSDYVNGIKNFTHKKI